jgi:hypothetical protein
LADDAGSHGTQAMRLMAKHGDDAVAFVISRPQGLALAARYGDDAAAALVKHKGIAEPVIEQFGASAVGALGKVSAQNGRRIAMMSDDLAKTGRAEELLGVIGKYGDAGASFVWRNKGTICLAAGCAAFIAAPEPFINGTKDLVAVVAENAIKPLAEVPGTVAKEAAGRVNWTWVVTLVVGVAAALLGAKLWLRREEASVAGKRS